MQSVLYPVFKMIVQCDWYFWFISWLAHIALSQAISPKTCCCDSLPVFCHDSMHHMLVDEISMHWMNAVLNWHSICYLSLHHRHLPEKIPTLTFIVIIFCLCLCVTESVKELNRIKHNGWTIFFRSAWDYEFAELGYWFRVTNSCHFLCCLLTIVFEKLKLTQCA